ncbi:MAG: hypothetical protein K2Q34_00465 [Alphaproteobacteria bacterium]|nr:hypothetical protein [Alphaproteobacteria bacterium]
MSFINYTLKKLKYKNISSIILFAGGCIIFLVLIVFLSIGKEARLHEYYSDTAAHIECINNLRTGRGAVSHVFSEIENYISHRYGSKSLCDLTRIKLEQPTAYEKDFFKYHAEYIQILFAILSNFISAAFLFYLSNIACFFGLLAVVVNIILKNTDSKIAPFLFLPFIILNPNWLGGLEGQWYPERLFVLFGILLCYACYIKRKSHLFLAFLVLFNLTINERSALVSGLILLFIPWVSEKENSLKYNLFINTAGIFLVAYFYAQKNLVLSNCYYSEDCFLPKSIHELSVRFSEKTFFNDSITLIVNNLPLLVFSLAVPELAFFSYLIFCLNLIGNVGGAEKIGWGTHYHSYYFPVLIFSAVIGFSKIYNKCIIDSSVFKLKKITFYSILILMLVFSVFSLSSECKKGRLQGFFYLGSLSKSSYYKILYGKDNIIKKDIQNLFPKHTAVSTTDAGMALLYDKVDVSMFPISIDKADYIFVPSSFIQDKIVIDWLKKKGFDSSSQMRTTLADYVVLTRIKFKK